jgi:predicted AlkP superfamily pyrophosphatase or phosphodiesterase
MKLLVIEVAALGYEFWEKNHQAEFWAKLKNNSVDTVFPAVTCAVQASFRTASKPEDHGMIANGFFDRKLKKAFFWEQASSLYKGARIWDGFRQKGGTVGQLCWQQSLGADSDLILSPAPIHKHHGGMIQDFYSRPAGLYQELCGKVGRKFNLFNYWGPFTSVKASRWITGAACEILKSSVAPELLLMYLPHLDYDLQKYGPEHPKAAKSYLDTELMLEELFTFAKLNGYEILIFGDYAITPAKEVVYPNLKLLEKGFFQARDVEGHLYPDLYSSKAFALVDHQVAHVYLSDREKNIEAVKALFENTAGVEKVSIADGENVSGGDLILEAEAGCWFAYPWWDDPKKAPDYACHVDIHSKPGFDPCELFMEWWPPMSITQDAGRICGTHGKNTTDECKVFLGSTLELQGSSILESAEEIKAML